MFLKCLNTILHKIMVEIPQKLSLNFQLSFMYNVLLTTLISQILHIRKKEKLEVIMHALAIFDYIPEQQSDSAWL